jgi:hypothetical protein
VQLWSLTTRCVQARFGGRSEDGFAVDVAAPPGSWVAQWRVRSDEYCGVTSLQGVLNDGTRLPPLAGTYDPRDVESVVMGEGGCFTEVHGR